MKKIYLFGGCLVLLGIGAIAIPTMIGNNHYRQGADAEAAGNLSEAEKHYEIAVKHKNAEAAYCLGRLYSSDIEADGMLKEKELTAYKKSLRYGKKEAAFKIAEILLENTGNKNDSLEAVKYLNMDAGENTKFSKDLLASLYLSSGKNAADTLQSVNLYKEAANLGNASSARNVSLYYFSVDDMEHGVSWLKKAADMGDSFSQYEYGNALFSGNYNLPKDMTSAFGYFKTAGEQKYAPAYGALGICYAMGYGTDVNYEKAFSYFSQGAALNDPMSMYNLAVCYDNGNGTAKNHNAAMEYYQKSAECGYELAINYLITLQRQERQRREEQERQRQEAERRRKQERVTCPVCHGTGVVRDFGTTGRMHDCTCGTCYGTGTVSREIAELFWLW